MVNCMQNKHFIINKVGLSWKVFDLHMSTIVIFPGVSRSQYLNAIFVVRTQRRHTSYLLSSHVFLQYGCFLVPWPQRGQGQAGSSLLFTPLSKGWWWAMLGIIVCVLSSFVICSQLSYISCLHKNTGFQTFWMCIILWQNFRFLILDKK